MSWSSVQGRHETASGWSQDQAASSSVGRAKDLQVLDLGRRIYRYGPVCCLQGAHDQLYACTRIQDELKQLQEREAKNRVGLESGSSSLAQVPRKRLTLINVDLPQPFPAWCRRGVFRAVCKRDTHNRGHLLPSSAILDFMSIVKSTSFRRVLSGAYPKDSWFSDTILPLKLPKSCE